MANKSIEELASVIRSKNAKAFGLTLDMMFKDKVTYERVKSTGVINKALIARLYGIGEEDVRSVHYLDMANAIKANIKRPIPCGNVGDPDVYGCQQHGPLYQIEIPWKEEWT